MAETNALVPLDKDAAIAAFNGDDNPFTQDAAEHGVTESGRLGFSGNTGNWKAGNDPIQAGSQYVFNCWEAKRGWMAWKNNKPIDYRWASINKRERLPTLEELPDHWDGVPKGKRPKETDGWSNVVCIPVRDMAGGPELECTLPAEGGYRPINKLLLQFGKEMKFHMDKATGRPKMPLVEIDSEAFDSKGGKKFAPVLKIVDWVSEADQIPLMSEIAEQQEDTPAVVEDVKEEPKTETKAQSTFRRQRVGS